jgi:hypothetical protein
MATSEADVQGYLTYKEVTTESQEIFHYVPVESEYWPGIPAR